MVCGVPHGRAQWKTNQTRQRDKSSFGEDISSYVRWPQSKSPHFLARLGGKLEKSKNARSAEDGLVEMAHWHLYLSWPITMPCESMLGVELTVEQNPSLTGVVSDCNNSGTFRYVNSTGAKR